MTEPNPAAQPVVFTPENIAAAHAETERLSHQLNITNADHIVLWLETNLAEGCGATLGYLACRIVEAHEGEIARLQAEVARLMSKLKEIAAPAIVPLNLLPDHDQPNGWRDVATARIDIARAALSPGGE